MKIIQMTSVHPWFDTRIFIKMCKTVAAKGHEVHLVVPRPDGPALEIIDGVTIHRVIPQKGRVARMSKVVREVLAIAKELDGDVYQFHDPEFLPYCLDFQNKVGKPVVFDSHEDYRLQAMYKHYVKSWFRPALGQTIGLVEDFVVNRLAGVLVATPSIAERFSNHPHCQIIQNFPITTELEIPLSEQKNRSANIFGFVGCVCEVRGVVEMINSIKFAGEDISLELGGKWSPPELRSNCEKLPGWAQIRELGFISRDDIKEMFRRISAGMIIMHPTESYKTAYPVKMFEYMAGSLPVIASDFPLWRSIVEEAQCGLLVDPLDEKAIGKAMRFLADNPEEAIQMGKNAKRAVELKYNWGLELEKLLQFYSNVTTS